MPVLAASRHGKISSLVPEKAIQIKILEKNSLKSIQDNLFYNSLEDIYQAVHLLRIQSLNLSRKQTIKGLEPSWYYQYNTHDN